MIQSQRWLVFAFGLGVCAAYALWATPDLPAPSVLLDRAAALPSAPFSEKSVLDQPGVTLVAPSVLRLDPPGGLDFGEVPVYEKRLLPVRVENPGAKPVTVTGVRVSCGCLQAEMKNKTIAPGQSQLLEVSFFATPKNATGTLSVALATDEAPNTVIAFPVKGLIRQEFLLEPVTLDFNQLGRKGTRTLNTVIRHAEGKPFAVKGVSASHKEFTFKWTALSGSNGSAYTVAVTATGIAPGQYTENAAILTDNAAVPAVGLNLQLTVLGDVACSPGVVWCAVEASEKTAVFETRVRRSTPGDLQIEKITDSEHSPLTFSSEPAESGVCRVKITLDLNARKAAAFGNFMIQTNAEPEPFRLPYLMRPKAPAAASPKKN